MKKKEIGKRNGEEKEWIRKRQETLRKEEKAKQYFRVIFKYKIYISYN